MKNLPVMILPVLIIMLAPLYSLAGETETVLAETSGVEHESAKGESAEEESAEEESEEKENVEEEEKGFGLEILGGRVKLAAIPIPGYNEAVGWSIGLMTAAYYRLNEADTISPESLTALFGFYAENETWAGGAYQKLHLSEDRWRIELGAAAAEVNFQAYLGFPSWIGGGQFVDYTTGTTFGVVKASRIVWDRLYLGVKYRFMRSETEFHTGLPIDIDLEARTFSGAGAIATWDSRDNIFYPRSGYLLDFWTLWNGDWVGSDQDYDIYEASLSGYRGFKEKHVVAARAHSRFATGDVPFEDQSVFFYMDLRGYTDGRYRADQRHTMQAEYRWSFYRRFSATGFLWTARR